MTASAATVVVEPKAENEPPPAPPEPGKAGDARAGAAGAAGARQVALDRAVGDRQRPRVEDRTAGAAFAAVAADLAAPPPVRPLPVMLPLIVLAVIVAVPVFARAAPCRHYRRRRRSSPRQCLSADAAVARAVVREAGFADRQMAGVEDRSARTAFTAVSAERRTGRTGAAIGGEAVLDRELLERDRSGRVDQKAAAEAGGVDDRRCPRPRRRSRSGRRRCARRVRRSAPAAGRSCWARLFRPPDSRRSAHPSRLQ